MKFLATLSAAAIVALAAAIPVTEEASNSPAPFDIELPTDLPTANDGAVLEYQGETISKRSVEKRADTTIDVWSGKSKGGRHETLHTDYNKCCMSSTPCEAEDVVSDNIVRRQSRQRLER
jgi:hypothetical protein